MKKLLLFPGNNAGNKQWIEDVNLSLKSLFEYSRILYYSHWESGASIIKWNDEISKIMDMTEFKPEDEITIFGKSAGVLLGMMALSKRIVFPKRFIFLGTPLSFAQTQGLSIDDLSYDLIQHCNSKNAKVLFIHQSQDTAGSAEWLKKSLEDRGFDFGPKAKFRFMEIFGNDHEYSDFNLYLTAVKEFVTND